MHAAPDIRLEDVQAEYGASGSDVAQLIMGEQVHVGGLRSTLALARLAGIEAGMVGVDLCCHSGAGMRALVRFCGVRQLLGVDATAAVVERGRAICGGEGFAERIAFVLADATATGLPSCSADFVWGEDAWCYVTDKQALIAEAARLLRPGGVVAFTDWVEGTARLDAAEADRLLHFMCFPSIVAVDEYEAILTAAELRVEVAEDTGLFAPCYELYRKMITMQLTYDALKTVGFDEARMEELERERDFVARLARDGKVVQGRFVARRAA